MLSMLSLLSTLCNFASLALPLCADKGKGVPSLALLVEVGKALVKAPGEANV